MAEPAEFEQQDGADEPQVRSMRVAAALTRKGGDEFVKPGKLVEVRFVKGQSLSLTASRLLALMILTAGGDAWRDTTHRMRKADIRRGHKGNERIVDMLEELHRTLFAEDDTSWRGKRATKRFNLIQASWEEVEDGDRETGWIEWQFTPDARRLIQESQTYAVMNRQAVLGFRSAYALKLYEEGALRLHRRQPVWKVDVVGLRAALGIDPEKYKDFAQLRRKVLTVAKAEIDQLSHFIVEWTETRRGRAVTDIEFRFVPKGAPAQIATVDELERHSAGRQARRDGVVEALVTPEPTIPPGEANEPVASAEVASVLKKVTAALAATDRQSDVTNDAWARFPEGPLHFGVTEQAARAIGVQHGGGWDVDVIADAYRKHMGDRLAVLSGKKLERSWKGWCETFANRRGRP